MGTGTRSGKSHSFCVIGAGIIGLSSAYCLAKKFPGCYMKVLYDRCSPATTSNHGFGICSIRATGDLDGPHAQRWTKQTAEYCAERIRQGRHKAEEMGIRALPAYLAYDKNQMLPDGTPKHGPIIDTFDYFRTLSQEEVSSLKYSEENLGLIFERKDITVKDLVVYEAGSWILDNHSYLPWLKKELELMEARGEISKVEFVEKLIGDFSEAVDHKCDILVNCSGLGSEYLVPDNNVFPIRGQYLLIQPNNDIDFRYGDHTFICPKPGRVALGSVYQRGRRDTALDPRDSEDILRRCHALNPAIEGCKIIKESVGIRPGRVGGPRVELEMRRLASRMSTLPVIHNYGHGARGIMQHWGCAQEVVKLAENVLKKGSKL